MAIEPKVEIKEYTAPPEPTPLNLASTIGVVGAFNSELSDLTVCTDARDAHNKFGTSETKGQFKGTDAIDGLFYGASSLFVANTTVWTGEEDSKTADTSLTSERLTAALNKLEDERFDILLVTEELTLELQTIVTNWLNKEFSKKYCHGQVIQVNKNTAEEYEAYLATLTNKVYYINTQPFIINGEVSDLNTSTAYLAGYIAGLSVDSSLTYQTIKHVTGLGLEYNTTTGEMGSELLRLNIPFLKCRNRRMQEYYCVNSMLPDGFDMYIYRVRDVILNHLAVEVGLGQRANAKTENAIVTLMEGLKQKYINELHLLTNLIYHIEFRGKKIIDLYIDKMVFEDIIDTINVYYSMEVQ